MHLDHLPDLEGGERQSKGPLAWIDAARGQRIDRYALPGDRLRGVRGALARRAARRLDLGRREKGEALGPWSPGAQAGEHPAHREVRPRLTGIRGQLQGELRVTAQPQETAAIAPPVRQGVLELIGLIDLERRLVTCAAGHLHQADRAPEKGQRTGFE